MIKGASKSTGAKCESEGFQKKVDWSQARSVLLALLLNGGGWRAAMRHMWIVAVPTELGATTNNEMLKRDLCRMW